MLQIIMQLLVAKYRNQIQLSKRRLYSIYCLKSYVKLIEMEVMGIVKQILMNPPLKSAKNPYFYNIV